MSKKHFTLLGIFAGLVLITFAAYLYPGGSQQDIASKGFSMQHNYLCNLSDKKAVDGVNNPGRYFAIAGMFVLCCGLAHFFFKFSKKLPTAAFRNIVAVSGIISMFFAFLAFTPYHDVVITIASSFSLLAIFTILVALYKSRLNALFFFGICCLLISYFTNYIYYTKQFLELLPVMQKLSFAVIAIWFLALEYFTTNESFELITKKEVIAG